jgi:hypothetical protein
LPLALGAAHRRVGVADEHTLEARPEVMPTLAATETTMSSLMKNGALSASRVRLPRGSRALGDSP